MDAPSLAQARQTLRDVAVAVTRARVAAWLLDQLVCGHLDDGTPWPDDIAEDTFRQWLGVFAITALENALNDAAEALRKLGVSPDGDALPEAA
jgi:hypothetical protein